MNYNLCRSDLLKEILKCQARRSVQIAEMSSIFCSLLTGQVEYFPQVYWIRNWNKVSFSDPEIDRSFSISGPQDRRDLQEEIASIREEFKNELKPMQDVTECDLEEVWDGLKK